MGTHAPRLAEAGRGGNLAAKGRDGAPAGASQARDVRAAFSGATEQGTGWIAPVPRGQAQRIERTTKPGDSDAPLAFNALRLVLSHTAAVRFWEASTISKIALRDHELRASVLQCGSALSLSGAPYLSKSARALAQSKTSRQKGWFMEGAIQLHSWQAWLRFV